MNTAAARLGTVVNVTEIVDNSPFTPLHWRAFVLCMACMVMDGVDVAAFGGFIAAALIPSYGWQAVFYFGGAIPIVIGVAMLAALPESLQFMALRGKDPATLARRLNAVSPGLGATANDQFVVREENKAGGPIVHLFHEGRAVPTLLFWLVNFMNLLNLYSLASWLPMVVRDSGYSAQPGVLVGTVLQA